MATIGMKPFQGQGVGVRAMADRLEYGEEIPELKEVFAIS